MVDHATGYPLFVGVSALYYSMILVLVHILLQIEEMEVQTLGHHLSVSNQSWIEVLASYNQNVFVLMNVILLQKTCRKVLRGFSVEKASKEFKILFDYMPLGKVRCQLGHELGFLVLILKNILLYEILMGRILRL